MKDLLKFAQWRVQLMRNAGIPASNAHARELVDDVHADTCVGDLPWDPVKCKLRVHLIKAIMKRTWQEIRHTHHVSVVLLHEAANDETLAPQVEKALSHVPRFDFNPTQMYALAATACQQLRGLAPRDEATAKILKCWEEGHVEREEIMKLTGLSAADYVRARKRLLYASRSLPSELRETAEDLLRSAS